MLKLPDKAGSYWRTAYTEPIYPTLTEDIQVDVVIVGAGITGLTSAYLLKQAGLTVAVLDKDTVGGGTTGRTTGKVTSQHGLIYTDLQKRLGKETARTYAEANHTAVDLVEKLVRKEGIECGWVRQDNYVFTASATQVPKFVEEAKIAAALGLPATFEIDTPLPFDIRGAVKFKNQGKLHAQKYVLGLAKAVAGGGSYVFEHSHAIRIHDGEPCKVSTTKATVTAKHIIVATNVPTSPLLARGGYCALEYPTESYIVAGVLPKHMSGMYISPDDDHYSILPVQDGKQRLLLIGGAGHLSGLRLSKKRHYQKLADYAEKHFGMTEIKYRWMDRDYLAYDGVPLIGKLYPWSKHLYVGSAYRKWGLSNGTVAGMILSDLITGKPNPWAATFNPNRIEPIKSIPRAVVKYITG